MNVEFEINEGSTCWLTISFYNKLEQLETPTTAEYEIWDIPSDTQIKTSTSLPVGTQVEVEIAAADNKIIDSNHYREARRVIVTAHYAGDQQQVQDFVYHVRNIPHKTI